MTNLILIRYLNGCNSLLLKQSAIFFSCYYYFSVNLKSFRYKSLEIIRFDILMCKYILIWKMLDLFQDDSIINKDIVSLRGCLWIKSWWFRAKLKDFQLSSKSKNRPKTSQNFDTRLKTYLSQYRGSPTFMVSTSSISTSTIFQKVLHKVVLVGDLINKFVLTSYAR